MQTYVKSLCIQNQKCKEFIQKEFLDADKAQVFLRTLQLKQPGDDKEQDQEETEKEDSE